MWDLLDIASLNGSAAIVWVRQLQNIGVDGSQVSLVDDLSAAPSDLVANAIIAARALRQLIINLYDVWTRVFEERYLFRRQKSLFLRKKFLFLENLTWVSNIFDYLHNIEFLLQALLSYLYNFRDFITFEIAKPIKVTSQERIENLLQGQFELSIDVFIFAYLIWFWLLK